MISSLQISDLTRAGPSSSPPSSIDTHRAHSTTSHQQIFAEMVKGLGESLVSGMVAGSSIAFAVRKDDLGSPHVLSYASKSEGMFVPESLIFRWALLVGWLVGWDVGV